MCYTVPFFQFLTDFQKGSHTLVFHEMAGSPHVASHFLGLLSRTAALRHVDGEKVCQEMDNTLEIINCIEFPDWICTRDNFED